MYSLLASIIALALTVAILLATVSYLDKPFYELSQKSIIIKVNQNYIDFGIILETGDGLKKNLSSIENIKEFNGPVPVLGNVDYEFIFNTINERIFYNNNITDSECLTYEKFRQKNSNLNINDITNNNTIIEYVENNNKNISCFKSSTDNNNYIVFIYPRFMN